MNTLMVVLRLIHIFAGIVWVGFGLFLLFLLLPTVRQMGSEGQVFMRGFLKRSAFNRIMPIASLLTTVAGVWIYYKITDGFDPDFMKSDNRIVLSIGSVAGLLAFGHGATATGPASTRLVKLGDAIEAQASPPTPDQVAQMQTLLRKMTLHGWISLTLLVISVIGMASAQYV